MNPTKMFPNAKTAEELRSALTKYFLGLDLAVVAKHVLAFHSGGYEYRFYWFAGLPSLRGGRLAVKRAKLRRDPRVEQLARLVRMMKTCALDSCRAAFEARGRKKYCKPACASMARRRRWQERHGKLPAYIRRERAVEEARRAEKNEYWRDKHGLSAEDYALDRDARDSQKALLSGYRPLPRPPRM